MTERWRLLTNWDEDAAFQMGLDALLLEDPDAPPTVRVYTWRPDALSLGYFQRFADVPAAAPIAAAGGGLVRRQTGGGAIHHEDELTFSLATSQADPLPLFRGPVAGSYERVHAAVAEALSTFGVDAALRGAAACSSDVDGTGMCFHASTPLDLVWGGRKGVGSAQRRTRERVLHHGSIKLGRSGHEPGVATVRETAPDATPAEVARALVRAFERRFGLALEPTEPSPDLVERARERGRAFTADAFLRRR